MTNPGKPIDEVVGFGIATISADVVISLIEAAFQNAPYPRTSVQEAAFSAALSGSPFVYAPPSDRDKIVSKLLNVVSDVKGFHLLGIVWAGSERRLDVGKIFEIATSRTTDRLKSSQLRYFLDVPCDGHHVWMGDLVEAIERSHHLTLAEICESNR